MVSLSLGSLPPSLQRLEPRGLAPAKGYSHGILGPSGGRVLFLAGQIGWNEDEELVGPGFAEQFDRALENLLVVVRSAGGRPEGLGQLTVFVTDKQEYLAARRELGEIWRRRVGRTWPAMALVEVSDLLEEGAKVEIQGIAVV